MSYQTALTIAEVVTDIHRKKYLLPAIQREFVWDTEQIERLFDSLMRDYPISSFLFWEVSKENVHEYRLSNLQMLEARPNIEKSDRPFDQWLDETYSAKADQTSYEIKHHMDATTPREFAGFLKFFDARQAIIKDVLKKILM